jgi:hypothetical protein
MRRRTALRTIKVVHTAVWAFFAGSIIAIPVTAWYEQWRTTTLLIALVMVECVVLLITTRVRRTRIAP